MTRKKFFFKIFFCAAAVFAFAAFGAHLPTPAQTDRARRAEIFEQVWNTINEKYYDARFNGVDWRAVGEKYRAQIKDVAGDEEFYLLLDRMAGELGDSHTRVYSPARREERRKQKSASAGISIKEIEKIAVITSVAPGTQAARLGIKPGMIVRSIDGVPIKKAIAAARREVGASSSDRATAMRVLSKLLAGEPDTFLKIRLQNEKGKPENFTLKRISVSRAPRVAPRILPSGIAYLEFNRFDEAIENQVTEAIENFKNAPALIVDLRGNAGGDGEMGLRFAGRFFDKKIAVARIVTRTGKPPIPEMPMTLETENKDGRFYAKPVVILIDERTASTAELISNALQETGRAKVFGTNSCGCVLAFLDYKPLPYGGDMTLSEFGFVTPRNKRLEGAGVTPDRMIYLRLKDLRENRDAALIEAEKYLSGILKKNK